MKQVEVEDLKERIESNPALINTIIRAEILELCAFCIDMVSNEAPEELKKKARGAWFQSELVKELMMAEVGQIVTGFTEGSTVKALQKLRNITRKGERRKIGNNRFQIERTA